MRLLLLLALLPLIGCGPSDPHPPERPLRLNLGCEPPSLDPARSRDITSYTLQMMLYEGLTRIDASGEPTLAAAESYTLSPTGTVYRFTLRPSLWSDRTPLTAHDFVRAWHRTLNPAFSAERPELFFCILNARAAKFGEASLETVGVWAEDDHTLVIELEHPEPHFLELVSIPNFYPHSPHGATNGPFLLDEHIPFRHLILSRSPTYWDADNVLITSIHLALSGDEKTSLYMFEQGELDWTGGPLVIIPFDALPKLREEGLLQTASSSSNYWYQFNPNYPPFNNPKIVEAFSLSIDRELIVRHISDGTHEAAGGLLATAHPPLPFDPERARELLAEGLSELGLTRASLSPLTLAVNNGDDHLQIAQAIQQQWEEHLGVTVELDLAEWQVHLSRIARGDFQIARNSWEPAFSDSSDSLAYFAELSTGPPPVAPLFFISNNYLASPDLQGVVMTPTGRPDFRWAELDHQDSRP